MVRSILLLLLVSLLGSSQASAQSEGDVRLTGLPPETPSNNIGRLEIFWKGRWSTFCGLSLGGAQAACRQLGYLDFVQYKPLNRVDPELNITEASPDTPIAIGYTECDRSFSNGLLHVLRCGYSTEVTPDCNHSNDIVLKCQTSSLWEHPYETEVRLKGGMYSSMGTLEIFINRKWGNVCGNKFDQIAADSACRQMGYTSALAHSTTPEDPASIIWLEHLSCNKSCSCLNGCFSGNTPITPIITCGNDKNVVTMQCTFDTKIARNASSGSYDICVNKEISCSGPPPPGGNPGGSELSAGGTAAVVIGGMVVMGLFGLAILVGVFFWIVPRYKRGSYRTLSTNS